MRSRIALTLCTLVFSLPVEAQTAADSAGIRATALDYGQGWYEGNAERMERALHPELVKRIVVVDTVSKKAQLDGMGKSVLVNYTRRGFGTRTPEARRKAEVVICDITGDAAIVKLTMADWVDYMQLGRFEGRWQIVNVLWVRTPAAGR